MRKVILFVFSVIIVLLIVAVFFILNNQSSEMTEAEKQKALTQIAGRKLNLGGNQAPTGDQTYKGKYSSFLYPNAAKVYKQTINGQSVKDEGALDYFSFDLDDPKVIVTTEVIEKNTSISKLFDYPGVSVRESQPDLYTKKQIITAKGVAGSGFDKKDSTGFEKTAFFMSGGKIYTVSVTGADGKAVTQIYDKIISSIYLY